jgi:Fic family protein
MVSFWRRWTEEPDFPAVGTSEERLEYAIRRHCETQGTTRFYLSARDAATITGTNFSNANQALHRLVNARVLSKVGKRLHARHAQNYRLITKDGP